ncbi:hypothetical protein MPTK2_4g20190 [Marchantia polymorpha subsp. ruderalis]
MNHTVAVCESGRVSLVGHIGASHRRWLAERVTVPSYCSILFGHRGHSLHQSDLSVAADHGPESQEFCPRPRTASERASSSLLELSRGSLKALEVGDSVVDDVVLTRAQPEHWRVITREKEHAL